MDNKTKILVVMVPLIVLDSLLAVFIIRPIIFTEAYYSGSLIMLIIIGLTCGVGYLLKTKNDDVELSIKLSRQLLYTLYFIAFFLFLTSSLQVITAMTYADIQSTLLWITYGVAPVVLLSIYIRQITSNTDVKKE